MGGSSKSSSTQTTNQYDQRSYVDDRDYTEINTTTDFRAVEAGTEVARDSLKFMDSTSRAAMAAVQEAGEQGHETSQRAVAAVVEANKDGLDFAERTQDRAYDFVSAWTGIVKDNNAALARMVEFNTQSEAKTLAADLAKLAAPVALVAVAAWGLRGLRG